VQELPGRVEDVVIGKDGREMVRFHGIFNGLVSVKNAQVIQESYDEMKIKIVPDFRLNIADEKTIRQRIESQLGNINIFIEEVNEIPLNNNGKYRAVISKVKRKL
jgi:phenylacetate-CoA ligase